MGREVLIPSPWDPVRGHMGMAQSCARGGLDWTLRSIFSLKGGQTLNRLPGEVIDAPCLSVFKRHLDYALNSLTFGQP